MVRLDGFSTDDLVDLGQVYNRLADRDDVSLRWQAWGREVAEAIAIELAGRLIAQAEQEGSPGPGVVREAADVD
jgi:hypothetical protein